MPKTSRYNFARRPNFWIACFTGALLLVNMIYAFFALKQWGEMQESNSLTQQSNEISARAWLVATKVSGFGLIFGKEQKITISIKNVGQGPATSVVALARLYTRNTPLPEHARRYFDIDNSPYSRLPLGPDQYITRELTTKALSAAEITAIENGATYLYLHGWAEYRDQFPKTRLLCFCWVYEPEAKQLVYCENNNELECTSG